ncbi:ornithine carbamoyltransferase [Buchnera aphidicola]|uniref:ornithine carbamoyltransferase n=1 Tax=Buchnera aphidicola TaxID=9 RepID=UPI003CE50A19
MNHLYQRHCLRLFDFNALELKSIIKLAQKLKKNKQNNTEIQLLQKKNIVLIFEKESTRTRCAFELAAFDQGAHVTYLGPGSTHIGEKESISDTAKILGRLYDGIQYRGHDHKKIEILADNSNVPVWNGLTKKFHPTQLLADLLTIQEIYPNKKFHEITCAYVGDASNNIGNSLLEAALLFNFTLRIIAPKKYWPEKKILKLHQENQKNYPSNIIYTENIQKGVKNVDFIYTDVWMSMGESQDNWEKRIQLLRPYQVNTSMLDMTNNPDIKVLHCLPALHDQHTEIGRNLSKKYGFDNGIEITHDVFQKNEDIIFQQAENRLHTIKAILISSLLQKISL